MITEEHLKHWIKEIDYALTGLQNEIHPDKTKIGGVKVGDAYVSFSYLQEKSGMIHKLLRMIESDIKTDTPAEL